LDELTFTGNNPPVLNAGGNMRAFRALGLTAGSDTIAATLPAGGAYSVPLAVDVTPDTDNTGTALATAFQESRAALQQVIPKLTSLNALVGQMAMGLPIGPGPDEEHLLDLVAKWLGTPPLKNPDGTPAPNLPGKLRETQAALSMAILLLQKNLDLKTSG